MNLEQLRIAIRPRRDWEAVDLGLQMARQWWWPMQRIWLLVTLPWILMGLLLPADSLWLVSLSLWWCKPLFERPLLMILSQAVFGFTPSTKEILRALPKLIFNQIFASLTWRRFSLTRSMDLPVIQLEGLRGKERSNRLQVLHRDDSGPATWLTIIGVHVESFLMISGLALLGLFIPAEVDLGIDSLEFWGESKTGGLLLLFFSYSAMALIGPLFVACGFSLYLNRRVKLEGWDIEIAFKRMVQKRGLQTFVLLAAIAFFNSLPQSAPPVWAADERAEIREQIIAIRNGPDFHQMKTHKIPKWQTDKEPELDSGFIEALFKLLEAFGRFISSISGFAEIILWGLVLALVAWVALRYGSWLSRFPQLLPRKRRQYYQPKTLFGMAVTEESLPADVSAAALDLWQRQQPRQALALLYRASLARLLQSGAPLREDHTELECLKIAKQQSLPADALAYFSHLTQVWRQLAYGHELPDNTLAESLCRNWNHHWPDGARV
jgi:hypothetical protein